MGIPPMVRILRACRNLFQRIHNDTVQQLVRTLHILFVILLAFLIDGKLLDMTLVLSSDNMIDMMDIGSLSKMEDTSYPKKPTSWRSATVLKDTGLLFMDMAPWSYTLAYRLPREDMNQGINPLAHNRTTLDKSFSEFQRSNMVTSSKLQEVGHCADITSACNKRLYHGLGCGSLRNAF